MKVYSSIPFFISVCGIFIAMNPALGYQYGESCCTYNGERLGDCQFYASKNRLRIEWSDGLVESYELVSQSALTIKTYADKRGGLWEYSMGAQGNQFLYNKKNGNAIFKPLRGCVD